MKLSTTKKWLAKLLILAMLVSVCSTANFNITASAADTQDFQITGTYGQTEARTMLAMINDFRTGKDAWQWDEADNEKVQVNGQRLDYDYNLEKIAMQRAMELVVAFSHTSPNGENVLEAHKNEYQASSENIAIGNNLTAAKAFAQLQETNEKYAGQGHRRNMLSDKFHAVGIGHVTYKGWHYWVQVFGDRVVTAAATPANDAETAVVVPVSTANITAQTCTPSVDRYQITVGNTAVLPTLSFELRTKDTWTAAPSAQATTKDTPAWQIKDTAIATISGTNILAVSPGATSLTTSVNGQSIEIPITVTALDQKKEDLKSASITLSPKSYTYNGKAALWIFFWQCPAPFWP